MKWLNELLVFIKVVWLLITHTKPYRKESNCKAVELYKKHIWPWLKEDRSMNGLQQAAREFICDRDCYFNELERKIECDETLQSYIDTIFTMGGFKKNGKEISKEELEKVVNNTRYYVGLIVIVILFIIAMLSIRYYV